MPTDKVNMIAGLYNAFAHEQIAGAATAKVLTSSEYINSNGEYAKRAVITVEDASIRYCYDGTVPTTTIGHRANPMDVITLIGSSNIKNFQFINLGGTNSEINVTYEK